MTKSELLFIRQPGILPPLRAVAGKLLAMVSVIAVLACCSFQARAISCTPQGEFSAADRESLLAASTPLFAAVASQNFDLLRSSLLPSVIPDWDGIRNAVQGFAPLLQNGTARWRNAYLLDATDLKAPADSQFFCTNADSSMTVSINLHNLPPGRYALVLADYVGSPSAGQLAMILGFDGQWKVGGVFAREGSLEGHDGIWFWNQAREQSKKNADWSAWFSYDAARALLLPVDFISSPNLEKLNQEQLKLKTSPLESLPATVKAPPTGPQAGKSWKVTALHLDTTLHFADLSLTYEGSGLTDPIAAKSEATLVASAFLSQHPDLRNNLHGFWVYAARDGKNTYAIELPMHDIP